MPVLLLINLAGKVAAVLVGWSAPATTLALWLLPDALLAYHVFVPGAQGIVPVVRRFATTRREVWLTIDDGPDPDDTPRILDLLAAHGARATFFVVGKNAMQHPHLVSAMLAAGQEIAHHTQTHSSAWFWCASPRRVREEIDAPLAWLHSAGVTPTRFRAPVGIKSVWLAGALRRRGLTYVGWSARGRERLCRDVNAVVARVTGNLRPGAILLLHEGPRVPASIRVTAIRHVLEQMRARGYRCIVPTAGQLSGPSSRRRRPARHLSA